MATDENKIEENVQPAGVAEGTELKVVHPDGSVTVEVVVHDLDENGNVVGFHKEATDKKENED